MTRTRYRVWIRGLVLVLLPVIITPVRADEAQLEIFNAGLFLGWAKGQLELEGKASNAAVVFNLNRARNSMEKAERLLRPALREIRNKDKCLKNVVEAIEKCEKRSQRRSAETNLKKIVAIFELYRSGFDQTYPSDQSETITFSALCDVRILEIGFNLGQAWIAAGVPGNRARHQLNTRLADMYTAIQNGVFISVDAENRMIRAKSAVGGKTICCFGAKSDWNAVPRLDQRSSKQLFEAAATAMRQVIAGAGVPQCGCDGLAKDEDESKAVTL